MDSRVNSLTYCPAPRFPETSRCIILGMAVRVFASDLDQAETWTVYEFRAVYLAPSRSELASRE